MVATISLSQAFNRFQPKYKLLTFASDSFRDVGILMKFPELLAAPLFNPTTFGRSYRVESGNRGKVTFSRRWTLVNMLVTVLGIAILAVYVRFSKDIEENNQECCVYMLTLLMVMCIAMVWMVPLMVGAKNPDNILSIMYQVLAKDANLASITFLARHFISKP